MPATFTASDQLAQPRQVHAGLQVARAVFNATTSFSLSDVVCMVKIPNGALIVDAYISGVHETDTGTATFKLGIGSGANPITDTIQSGGAKSVTLSSTALVSVATLSATTGLRRADGGLPIKVSLSDDAPQQYAWVYLTKITGTTTTTTSIQCAVSYYMVGIGSAMQS